MPRYEVNKDEADEALDPQGGNPKVSFNNKETSPGRKRSITRNVVIVVLVAICIFLVLLLIAWFIYTIIDTRPEWQTDNFHIETIPGVRYHPEHLTSGAMIVYNYTDPQSYKQWVDVIHGQLQDYLNTSHSNRVICDYDKPPRPGQVCAVDVTKWFPCIKSNNYGYQKGSPCVFVRFNKIFNWTAQYYDTPESLPEDMPANLKATIKREQQLFYRLGQTVWLSCNGVNDIDDENIRTIRYIPRMGFPGYFFPYNNTEHYLSPVVALYFDSPTKGVIINVECRIWAKNVEYNNQTGTGYVRFQLLVDY